MKFNKKSLAKEWIIFIGCLLFSILILPIIFYIIFYFFIPYEYTLSKMYSELFEAIFNGEKDVYLFILLPYILVQLVRSIIWSIKIIKPKNNTPNIKTLKNLRSKTWYKWLKIFYILCYFYFVKGFVSAWLAALEKLDTLENVPTKDWLWVGIMPILMIIFLYVIHKIIKKLFYLLSFKTFKPPLSHNDDK